MPDGTATIAARVATAAKVSAVAPPAISSMAVTTEDANGGLLRVEPGEMLATVNGVPLELKDLLPLSPESAATGRILSAERYAFLLERAVDREITLQQARVQGVDLTDLQREQLAKLRARSERPQANVFDDLQQNPANADFEERDATALLLLANLAEQAGVPARHVTAAQVEDHYQRHQAAYETLPADVVQRQAAWERIEREIRVKLAAPTQTRHDEALENHLKQLRASALIVNAVHLP